MSLDLDQRQRAMLEEMGIRLFWPEPAEAEVDARVATPRVAPVAAPMARPVAPAAVTSPPVATPALSDAALFGGGDPQPDYLLLLDPPTEEEERQGQPVLGDAGKLLDNMLAALGVSRRRRVYLACVPRAAEGIDDALRLQVEQLRPKVILAMGRIAVQGLLQTGEPPGRLRGRAHDYRGVPVVVTYHPVYLLRNLADKANAWADLCLARSLAR